MAARSPEDVDRGFAEALNAGDLDRLMMLYEPQAALAPMPDNVVTGHPAIRQALAGFLAAKPMINLRPRLMAQSGDLALVTADWDVSMTGEDGKPAKAAGRSIEVVRRQADGSWQFVIDMPFGAGAE